MYIQANIGRNIGNDPMSDFDWDGFAGSVVFAIYANANDPTVDMLDIEIHDGTGTYEGVSEDSRHISVYWDGGFDLDQLKADLTDIKEWYKQDAIALIVGSELI